MGYLNTIPEDRNCAGDRNHPEVAQGGGISTF